jgi:hypothetical protein
LINCLKPVVQILHTVSAVLAEATASVRETDPYLIPFLMLLH